MGAGVVLVAGLAHHDVAGIGLVRHDLRDLAEGVVRRWVDGASGCFANVTHDAWKPK